MRTPEESADTALPREVSIAPAGLHSATVTVGGLSDASHDIQNLLHHVIGLLRGPQHCIALKALIQARFGGRPQSGTIA